MEIVYALGGMIVLLLIVGTVVALRDKDPRREDEIGEQPRLVVAQQVPSTLDSFQHSRK